MIKSFNPFAHVIKIIGEENWRLLNDKSWMYQKYIIENKSSRDIAKILGCGKRSVLAALRRLDIDISPIGKNKSNRTGRASHLRQMSDGALGKVDDKDWLYEQFIILNKSAPQIGEETGVSSTCVRRWLKCFDINKNNVDFVQCCQNRFKEIHGFDMNSEENFKLILSRFKSETIRTNKGGIVRCHSSWEKIIAERFDEDDYVVSFGKDLINIKYDYNNKKRTYIVDFYVMLTDNRKYLIEVKAPRFLNDDMVKAKFEALNKYAFDNDIEYDIITDPKQKFKW